jgi:hypothetical protein
LLDVGLLKSFEAFEATVFPVFSFLAIGHLTCRRMPAPKDKPEQGLSAGDNAVDKQWESHELRQPRQITANPVTTGWQPSDVR